MPALALSRRGARVVESGPGNDLTAGAWRRLDALPDPAGARRRAYLPAGCLVAIAL